MPGFWYGMSFFTRSGNETGDDPPETRGGEHTRFSFPTSGEGMERVRGVPWGSNPQRSTAGITGPVHKSLNILIYLFILPITSLSFILTPLTSDATVFIGIEYIADHFYPLPAGWDAIWEIKPMGNRLLNWALYKIGSVVVPLDNPVMFSIVIKIIALVAVLIVSYYFSIRINIQYSFPLTVLAFIAVGGISTLQPEWWSSLAGVLAISFLLTDNKYLHLITGFLFAAMGSLKGISVLVVIIVLLAVYLLKPGTRYHWKYIAAGFFGTIIISLLIALALFPHAYTDILMSAEVDRIGYYSWPLVVVIALETTFSCTTQMPVACCGIFCAIAWFFKKGGVDYTRTLAMAGMWAAAFLALVVQGELLLYQYYYFTLPGLVTILLWGQA